MSRPHVIIKSPDESLCRATHDVLRDHVDALMTTQQDNVLMLARQSQSRVVVLDLRDEHDNGLRADVLLADLRHLNPRPQIILLTGPLCPVLVEPHLKTPGVLHRQGHIDGPQLARLVVKTLTQDFADTDPDCAVTTLTTFPNEARDNFNEAVFQGVTRRFETRSPQFKKMLDDLFIAAAHDVTILLIGETGSGKTFLSNLIHEISPRRSEPFLHVACGALPRELIESELFGHVKGAFTSAHADKEGKFVAARGGTVLLDEIDVLGPEQQVKLLRVIETGEFEPVGSNRTYKSQARLIAASNLDLQPLVEQHRFRPDLYYRLNMLKFEIPPLRKRKVDIIPMAKKFIARFQEKHAIRVHRIEDAFMDALLSYPWPGNVRELEHVVQRAVIYCRDGALTAEQLPAHILSGTAGPTNDPSVMLVTRKSSVEQSLESQVKLTEKEIIEQSLFKNNFSRTKTARDLGISRVTLYNKMKKYEMMK